MKAAQQRVSTAVQTRGGINHQRWYVRTIGVIVRRFMRTTVQLPSGIKHPWGFIHTLNVIAIRNGEERGILGNPWYRFTDIEVVEALNETGVGGGVARTMTVQCIEAGVLVKTPQLYQLSPEGFELLRPLLTGK